MITAPALDTPAIAVGGSRPMQLHGHAQWVCVSAFICEGIHFSKVLSEITAGWELNVPEIVSI